MRLAESAFWSVLFITLGTILLMARTGTEGAWPILAGGVSYCAAAFFLFHLLVRGDEPER